MSDQQTYTFQAEIQQLLNILVHSLYTERDIFLRELISNASDALNRIQFELLTNREVADTTSTSGGAQAVAIQRTLPAGTYYFSVQGIGVGDPFTTGYSSYGSRGNYTVTATVPAAPIVAINPTNLTVTAVGNLLQLTWPAGHIGWRLETQTNALNSGLGTTWYNVAGATTTNRVFVPRAATSGSVLFRLAYP